MMQGRIKTGSGPKVLLLEGSTTVGRFCIQLFNNDFNSREATLHAHPLRHQLLGRVQMCRWNFSTMFDEFHSVCLQFFVNFNPSVMSKVQHSAIRDLFCSNLIYCCITKSDVEINLTWYAAICRSDICACGLHHE